VDTLPALRNEYAHGSQNLYNSVLRMIKVVSEIINQLFEAAQPKSATAEVGVA
jgi:hypothetical protein